NFCLFQDGSCVRRSHPLTTCMPCSFGRLRQSRSAACAQPNGLRGVTVIDRYVPLVSAAYGTRVGTAGANDNVFTWRRRLQLDFSVRPVRGDDCLNGKLTVG